MVIRALPPLRQVALLLTCVASFIIERVLALTQSTSFEDAFDLCERDLESLRLTVFDVQNRDF